MLFTIKMKNSIVYDTVLFVLILQISETLNLNTLLPEYSVFNTRDKSTKKKVYLSCYHGYSCFFQKKNSVSPIYVPVPKPEN